MHTVKLVLTVIMINFCLGLFAIATDVGNPDTTGNLQMLAGDDLNNYANIYNQETKEIRDSNGDFVSKLAFTAGDSASQGGLVESVMRAVVFILFIGNLLLTTSIYTGAALTMTGYGNIVSDVSTYWLFMGFAELMLGLILIFMNLNLIIRLYDKIILKKPESD